MYTRYTSLAWLIVFVAHLEVGLNLYFSGVLHMDAFRSVGDIPPTLLMPLEWGAA
jgi:hypothetical protein